MKYLIKTRYYLLLVISLMTFSCDDEVETPTVTAPSAYAFTRDGATSVSFSGQTTRIGMAEELVSALKDFTIADANLSLLEMYRNETGTGEDANPFADEVLNSSTKSIKSKVAASTDFFSANTTEANEIKARFESWIQGQVNEVFSSENSAASAGNPGQIADGSSTRYVNGQGLEYNQAIAKSLIGALMLDQIVNNYLSPAVLDEADNKVDNDAGTVAEGKSYTTMEHKWDEAYGYVYGASASETIPNATIGDDDSFLNKYIGRVKNDTDFAGIEEEIFDAFKLGRAAIVAKQYDVRDVQAEIIKQKLSTVIGVRAVYYLQQGKNALTSNQGGAFHDLSEGYGFIYSLRFTRKPGSSDSYFTKAEVDGFLEDLMGDGTNGLWDVKAATLDAISESIAAKFDFTVAQAGE